MKNLIDWFWNKSKVVQCLLINGEHLVYYKNFRGTLRQNMSDKIRANFTFTGGQANGWQYTDGTYTVAAYCEKKYKDQPNVWRISMHNEKQIIAIVPLNETLSDVDITAEFKGQ